MLRGKQRVMLDVTKKRSLAGSIPALPANFKFNQMGITFQTVAPREVLENVFVTALEGGSNYWYYLSEGAVRLIRKAVPKNEDPYLSSAILKAVLDHDVQVPISDADNEDDVLGYVSAKTIQERIQKLSQDEGSKWALEQELEGNGDGDSSDVVFQWLVMGEVVFG
jgi:hypothetical protein